MHLLGWSRGGMLAYAYAAAESQLPAGLRHVSGIIPVDIYLKTDVESRRQDACARHAEGRALIDAGYPANGTGMMISALGGLAQLDPAGASPVFAGLDNANAGMLVGAATFLLMPRPPVPSYHLVGGLWNQDGSLADLVHTDRDAWFDIIARGRPYEPWALIAESDAAICDDPAIVDVAFDDHLGDVEIPVLYVGAGGGFGASGVYTTTRLGSSDVTAHVVELFPEEERLFDVGHTDIFQGADADVLFWEPIRAWIEAH
jgi:pimeloyl-ACP methyl ester carboxylesterase